ncbi:MAG: Gfo/Idh/MocA family oxidoreductase [Clostridiaceae bacterium]|nr:Gfo/Idh/MocA family oxidoreductase [Clostridiaceae bacterium]
MDRICKIAMIGAGERACKFILPALLSAKDDVEIIALCDINEQRARQAAQTFHIEKTYSGSDLAYRAMIEELQPDAVVAVGQPHILYDTWMWILGSGIPLMIEKPLGLSMHQTQALCYLAQKNHCVTQVAFQRRVSPMVVKMRELCLDRGPITHALCKFYKYEPVPFLGARDHILDDTVHAIDTLRWMCGGDVVALESHARCIGVPDINFVTATLTFSNGANGVLINSWTSGKREFSVEMHAPGIYVQAEHEGKSYVYTDGSLTPAIYDAREVAGSDDLWDYTGVTALCRSFARAVTNGSRPSSPFEDACQTMRVAFDILAQAQLSGPYASQYH